MRDHPAPIVACNIASVPHRSPFRYPGGKTWLIPQVRQWLKSLPQRPTELIEPFAGGAIVSLTVVAENLAEHVRMVEIDDAVASVWQTIIHDEGGGKWLANRIARFSPSADSVKSVLGQNRLSPREKAFQTILKNRVSRGGILAAGAGLIKVGESNKGLLSRWYPETLKKRILDVVEMSDRITFIHGDGVATIRKYARQAGVVFFIDPPYTISEKQAGNRLYQYTEVDHEKLFEAVAALRGDFLMTHEDSDEVRDLADLHKFDVQPMTMKNTHHARVNELIVGCDLSWLKRRR